jgi:hypothetical protein
MRTFLSSLGSYNCSSGTSQETDERNDVRAKMKGNHVSLMALKTILFSFYMSSQEEKKGISELMNEREIVYKRAING